MFAHTQLTQCFLNTEDSPIEAVYTFPTPHGAVFLGLEVTIGEKTLKGVVMPDARADRGYEEAIQDGDAAVLLREVEPGLYSVSVGNILPGEAIALTYTYAKQLRWQGNTLRLTIPTTIAPRYGNPAVIKLAPQESIEHRFGTGYALTLNINVTGLLSLCAIASPSHQIQTQAKETGVDVRLSDETTSMDRDMVLTLTSEAAVATPGIIVPNRNANGVTASDGCSWAASVGFYLPIPENSERQSGLFNLVIDCSGSMAGDAIYQAKMAARQIVESLEDSDRFNLTAFGSHAQTLFAEPMPVNTDTVEQAQDFIASLDANLGGTAIAKAIMQACPKRARKAQNSNILLIIDGQVYGGDDIVKYNRQRGHRIFTLGVGSAVSGAFLCSLAAETGGACELVAPNEHMAQHIVRHFGRMRQPRVVKREINWGSTPLLSVPNDLAAVFAGDTLHVGARFALTPKGPVTLVVTYEDGTIETLSAPLEVAPDDSLALMALPRVLANQRLPALTNARRLEMALEYQLLTDGTKCLMTYQRAADEKAEDLPELRTVPNEHPAGWGGAGSMMPGRRAASQRPPLTSASRRIARPRPSTSGLESDHRDYCDTPSFLRRQVEPDIDHADKQVAFSVSKVKDRLSSLFSRHDQETDSRSLKILNISRELREKLAKQNIRMIHDLLTSPRSEWSSALGLTDGEVAALLKALRAAGYTLQ